MRQPPAAESLSSVALHSASLAPRRTASAYEASQAARAASGMLEQQVASAPQPGALGLSEHPSPGASAARLATETPTATEKDRASFMSDGTSVCEPLAGLARGVSTNRVLR